MSENKIDFEYEGTTFELTEIERWRKPSYFEISGIKSHGQTIAFPITAAGKEVHSLRLYLESRNFYYGNTPLSFPNVEKIVIPPGLELNSLKNTTFPDLCEVELKDGNTDYSTDGKMLFSANGKELILSLAAGMQKGTVHVPEYVTKIGSAAFRSTICSEIIFDNPDVSAEPSSFNDSVWLNTQLKDEGGVYVGNTFFLASSRNALTIAEGTQRISRLAFEKNVPVSLTTPVVPIAQMKRGAMGCKELIVTSDRKINWNGLSEWESLASVQLTKSTRYKSIDGVVFSADGRELIFYPQCREEEEYMIPDGVQVIGRRAFAGQLYLKKVTMPKSVTAIRQAAFTGCRSLSIVELSDNIKEIPDATAFQTYGVFQDCRSLTSIKLPDGLWHLGSNAFRSAKSLSKISLPSSVQMIGEYAFYNTAITYISLPDSLRIIGKGALCGTPGSQTHVTAYEGSARGLVGALEAAAPGMADSTANVIWRSAKIVMLDKNGARKDEIVIPLSLKHSSASYIDSAWNQPEFDYDEYDRAFEDVSDANEKASLAIEAVSRGRELADSPYESYLRRTGTKVISRIINECDEERIVEFLKQGYLTNAALKSALKLCNEKGLNTAAAYILSLTQKKSPAKKTMAIRL